MRIFQPNINIMNSIKNLQVLTQSVTIDITALSVYDKTKGDIARITSNIKLAAPLTAPMQFVLPDCDAAGQVKFYLPDGSIAQQQDFDPTALEDVTQLQSIMRSELDTFIATPTKEIMTSYVKNLEEYLEFKTSKQVITIPANQQYFTFTFSKYISKNENNEYILETSVPFSGFRIDPNLPGAQANVIVLMPYELGQDVNKVLQANWIAPNSQPQSLDKKVESGRIMVSKYWKNDPAVLIKYKY